MKLNDELSELLIQIKVQQKARNDVLGRVNEVSKKLILAKLNRIAEKKDTAQINKIESVVFDLYAMLSTEQREKDRLFGKLCEAFHVNSELSKEIAALKLEIEQMKFDGEV